MKSIFTEDHFSMNQRHKKYSAYFLLIVILFLTVGSYVVLYILEINIKTSVQITISTLSQDELHLIELPYTEGAEKKCEIVSGGRFYDVVSYEISNQTIFYYCYFDKAETDLIDLSAYLFDETDDDSDEGFLTNLLKIASAKYITPSSNFPVYYSYFFDFYSHYQRSISTHLNEVCTPPPQIFS